jgi:hypothetical protein
MRTIVERSFSEVRWIKGLPSSGLAAGPVATSLYDAEREMRYPSSLYHEGALQLDRLGA